MQKCTLSNPLPPCTPAGFLGKAVRVQQRLLQRFPEDLALRNQLGVSFLMMNQAQAAKEVFQEVLNKDPGNGFGQVSEDCSAHCVVS